MIGPLVIMEFKPWTAEAAAEAFSFDAGVPFALHLPRHPQSVSTRTVESFKRLLRGGVKFVL